MKDKIIMNNGKSHKSDNITINDNHSLDGIKDNIQFNIKSPKTVEERKATLIRDYSEVVVHDFGDEYHLSEEEKRSRSAYYEAYRKLRQCKRKYRKLGEFVKVMRLCLECLDAVAENNGVYHPEDFKEKVIRGEITVNGLNFPKYVGKDRRSINWEYITGYITNTNMDYSELDKKKTSITDIFDIDYDDEEEVDRLTISQYGKTYDELFGDDIDTDNIKERSIKSIKEKNNKEIQKILPELQEALKNAKKKSRETNSVHSYVYQISKNDFDYIDEIDRRLNVADKIPKFKGDIMNKSDFDRYMRTLTEWEEEKTHVSYNGKLKTLEEAKELDIKASLESSGWNMRSFYKASIKAEEKKLKKENKRDKKEEKKLKKKLTKLQSARDKRNDDDMINTKKKKKKKKKKKDKGDD